MVRGRISPKTKDRFRKSIRDVIKGLSRKVQIYKQPIKKECPNCYYDKMTAKSTGKCKYQGFDEDDSNYIETAIDSWLVENPSKVRIDAPYKFFRVGRCPICRGDGYLEIRRRAWADC